MSNYFETTSIIGNPSIGYIRFKDPQTIEASGNVFAPAYFGDGKFLRTLPFNLADGNLQLVGGFVGVRKPSPEHEVDVEGNIRVSGSFIGNGHVLTDLRPDNISGVLSPTQIPSLDASKIATGVLTQGRIPALNTANITTGVFDPARIPPLHTANITEGVFVVDRIPNLDASKITTGVLDVSRIPPLDTSQITTGVLAALSDGNLRMEGLRARFFYDALEPVLAQKKGGSVDVNTANAYVGMAERGVQLFPKVDGGPVNIQFGYRANVDVDAVQQDGEWWSLTRPENSRNFEIYTLTPRANNSPVAARRFAISNNSLFEFWVGKGTTSDVNRTVWRQGGREFFAWTAGADSYVPLIKAVGNFGDHFFKVRAFFKGPNHTGAAYAEFPVSANATAGNWQIVPWTSYSKTGDVYELHARTESTGVEVRLLRKTAEFPDDPQMVGVFMEFKTDTIQEWIGDKESITFEAEDGVVDQFYLTTATSSALGTFTAQALVGNIHASNVTFGVLSPDRIPLLDASKVSTGQLHPDRIPTLDTSIIGTGVFNPARIPALHAANIVAGEFDNARIPTVLRPTTFLGNVSAGNAVIDGPGASFRHAQAPVPALAHTALGDTTLAGTTSISLQTDGTQRLVLTQGNVVAQTTIVSEHDIVMGGGSIRFTQLALSGTQADYASSFTFGDAVLHLSSQGMVGVGTGSPLQPLDVRGNVQSDGFFLGNGSQLHSLNASEVTRGVLSQAQVPELDASKITSGVFTQGRIPALHAANITAGVLALGRIPALDAANITTGVLALGRIPALDAANVTAGIFSDARIPDLDASKITGGVFDPARIPALDAANVGTGVFDVARIPDLDSSKITSGVLDLARIPALPASQTTSGTFNPARIPALSAANVTSGVFELGRIPALHAANVVSGVFSPDRIPGLDASKIVSNAFSTDRIPGLDASKTTSGVFQPDRIPGLDASKIVGNTFNLARIPPLHASNIAAGVFALGRIPPLHASNITSGVFEPARIPPLDGSIISTGTLSANAIPDIDASKITSGVLNVGRIPNMDASKIVTGVFTLGRIPALHAANVTAGTFDPARIPALDAANVTTGTFDPARIPPLDAANISSGVFNVSRLPNLDASKITTGVFSLGRIPSLSAGNVTSGVFDTTRIPNNIADGTIRVVSGNVGIQMEEPRAALEIGGSGIATALLVADGTPVAPGFSFDDDTNTGIYRPEPSTLGFVCGGEERARFSTSNVHVLGNVKADYFIGNGAFLTGLEVSADLSAPINGDILPAANVTFDLGAPDARWADVFSGTVSTANLISNVGYITDRLGIGIPEPSSALHVLGNIRATGEVFAFSDGRFKTEIVTIPNALHTVMGLRGVEYTRSDTGGSRKVGLVAQEVEQVLPHVVQTDSDGLKSVAYGPIIGVLIEAVKELAAQVRKQPS
jgi:hypothetical protein